MEAVAGRVRMSESPLDPEWTLWEREGHFACHLSRRPGHWAEDPQHWQWWDEPQVVEVCIGP